jgi:hypothetical protein
MKPGFTFTENFKDSCVYPLMLKEIKGLGLQDIQAKFLSFNEGIFTYVIGNIKKRVVIKFCSKRTFYRHSYDNAKILLDDNEIAYIESFIWYGYELEPGGHKYIKVSN